MKGKKKNVWAELFGSYLEYQAAPEPTKLGQEVVDLVFKPTPRQGAANKGS